MSAPDNQHLTPGTHKSVTQNLAPLFIATVIIATISATIHTAAYTDGILQLTAFKNKAGLYPPLYAVLSTIFSFSTTPTEIGGRIVSVLAIILTQLIVAALALRLSGQRAAWLAALFFLLSPLVWHWSGQIMTDPLYMALSTAALFSLTESWWHIRKSSQPRAARWLAGAVALGALATLTRYQGALLAPLLALVAIIHIRRFRAIPWLTLAAGLLWFLVPAWMWYNGFVHQEQFASRSGPTPMATFFAWWNTFESFILISPYYFGYPIVAAAILGIFHARAAAPPWYPRPAAILWGTYALLLLALQARFGSFQYRYMMPLLPMVVVFAGVGFQHFETRFTHRPWLPRWALIISVIYLTFFGLSILFLQGNPYRDQYQAAQYIKQNVPVTTPVYSNERYGSFTSLGSIKLSFWAGRPVNLLLSPDQPIKPGSILVLGTAYGGNEAVVQIMQQLSQRYQLRPLTPEPYESTLVPLMDDVMVNPMFNQNPMGWVMRYVPQTFATQLFEVQPLAAGSHNG